MILVLSLFYSNYTSSNDTSIHFFFALRFAIKTQFTSLMWQASHFALPKELTMRSIIALRSVRPSFNVLFKLTKFVFFARWNYVILHLHEQVHVRIVMLIISAYINSVIYLILLVFRDSISISPFSITWNVRDNWFDFIIDLFLYKGYALVKEKRIGLDNVV